MKNDALIKRLKELAVLSHNWMEDDLVYLSPVNAHEEADDLLLEFINDKEIEEAFKQIERWYD